MDVQEIERVKLRLTGYQVGNSHMVLHDNGIMEA